MYICIYYIYYVHMYIYILYIYLYILYIYVMYMYIYTYLLCIYTYIYDICIYIIYIYDMYIYIHHIFLIFCQKPQLIQLVHISWRPSLTRRRGAWNRRAAKRPAPREGWDLTWEIMGQWWTMVDEFWMNFGIYPRTLFVQSRKMMGFLRGNI